MDPREKYDRSYKRQRQRIAEETGKKKLAQKSKLLFLKRLYNERIENKFFADIGGGSGGIAVQIAIEGGVVVVLDISRIALSLCREHFNSFGMRKSNHLILGDAHKLPFKEGCFDVVILTDILEHLTCPEIALFQAKRILTSNGYVYFIVPNIFSIYNLPVDFADHILSRLTGKTPSHLHFFTKRRITAMFESEGFAIKKLDKLNNFLSRSWMGLAKKDRK